MRILGLRVDLRAVGLALLFAVPATVLLVLLRGYYAEGLPLLLGWLVVYALVVQRLTG